MKKLEEYTWEELLEATSGKESQKESAKEIGYYTLEKNIGIHTQNSELRKEWAVMGGEAAIDKLLEWQKENDYRVCDFPRNENWNKSISNALKGRNLSEENKQKLSESLISYMSKLDDSEKSKKYSNDSSSRKSLKVRKEILDSIEGETFTTSQARLACEKYGLGNWKGFLKDNRLVVQIHKGTNQQNPSVYKKI